MGGRSFCRSTFHFATFIFSSTLGHRLHPLVAGSEIDGIGGPVIDGRGVIRRAIPSLHLRLDVSEDLANLPQEDLVRIRRRQRGSQRERVSHPHAPARLVRHRPRPFKLPDEPLLVQCHLHVPPRGFLLNRQVARKGAAEDHELPPALLAHQQPPIVQISGLDAVHGAEDAGRRGIVGEHPIHGVGVAVDNHLSDKAVLAAFVAQQLALRLLEDYAASGRRRGVICGRSRVQGGFPSPTTRMCGPITTLGSKTRRSRIDAPYPAPR
mmetsp:Transcript_554/g.2061  ORF Transcript_554/g.2061 Transcript_554/m.2061 type:complete len:266 (-) Transcript_554:197-994(-)